jgi:hypothetical protein
MISALQSYENVISKAAAHLKWPEANMHAAAAYMKAFPDEIEEAIQANTSFDFAKLSRLLPDSQSPAHLPQIHHRARST